MSQHNIAPDTGPTEEQFIAVADSEEFRELRGTFRGFVFPLFIAFIVWYVAYIVTATFFPDFVQIKVWGNINVGMALGAAQYVTTALVTWAYIRFADNKLDPASARIREMMENDGPQGEAPQVKEAM